MTNYKMYQTESGNSTKSAISAQVVFEDPLYRLQVNSAGMFIVNVEVNITFAVAPDPEGYLTFYLQLNGSLTGTYLHNFSVIPKTGVTTYAFCNSVIPSVESGLINLSAELANHTDQSLVINSITMIVQQN